VKHAALAPKPKIAYFGGMKPGTTVFPIAPSSAFDQHKVERGIALLRAKGFDVIREAERRDFKPVYLNGNDQVRLAELHQAINSQACDLMWMARGGYGLTRIVPSLELPNKKIPTLVGLSDTTALHCHLWRHKKQKGIHGSNLMRLDTENSDALGVLWSILEGRAKDVHWPDLRSGGWGQDQEVQGPLIVANLCVLTHLIGTISMPDLKGCIVVLEEIGERPYRIDRMLTQLWHSGSLSGVKAIAIGQLSDCDEPDHPELTAQSVIFERCRTFGISVCEGLPVGHEVPNWALPFGAWSSLTHKGGIVKLSILEELF
jgi:muramoyltetrapeptide carboxypeptidase